MLAFFFGLMIGGCLGVLVAALCVAAARNDREVARMMAANETRIRKYLEDLEQ